MTTNPYDGTGLPMGIAIVAGALGALAAYWLVARRMPV